MLCLIHVFIPCRDDMAFFFVQIKVNSFISGISLKQAKKQASLGAERALERDGVRPQTGVGVIDLRADLVRHMLGVRLGDTYTLETRLRAREGRWWTRSRHRAYQQEPS